MHPHSPFWRPIAALVAVLATTMLATSAVTIAPGDTLSVLAEEHGVTVDELMAWNDLDDADRIVAGRRLVVSAPSGSAPSAAAGDVHVVTAGDTLGAIAARIGSTVARLAAANGLADPDRIVVGQRLRLTDAGPAEPVAATVSPAAATHTVAAGDTLSTVALRYGVTVASLATANDLADPDRIRIGQILTIAGSGAGTASQDPAPPPTTTPPPATAGPAPTGTAASPVLVVPRFAEWARAYRVPQDLLEAIAWHESYWRPDTIGPDGHLGIMQLSPSRVALIEGGLIGRDLEPLDAGDNIQMGARFLRYLLDRTSSEHEAVAAWGQGLTSVQRNGVSAAGDAYAATVEEIRRQRR